MNSEYVDLSTWSYTLWWLVILVIHVITCGYNAIYTYVYWGFELTYLYASLQYVRIGIPARDHPSIAVVNLVMAALHGGCVLVMIGGSFRHRKLTFTLWSKDVLADNETSVSARLAASHSNALLSVRALTVRVYYKIWDRKGLLGVNGANFHVLIVARKLVATGLQSIQAYRMSWLLPRMTINRFYLGLLVLNCWSSMVFNSSLFKRSEARRRFACILLDCVLNLTACIGIPLLVVLRYIDEYDFTIAGFELWRWYDDEWTARMLNEIQLVVVVSWADIFSRIIFSLGVLFAAINMKELLRREGDTDGDVQAAIKVKPRIHVTTEDHAKSNVEGLSIMNRSQRTHATHGALPVVHFLFGMWGIAVLGLHIQASVRPQLPQCLLQVHPWGISQPACYLAALDCHRIGISGKFHEVETNWNEFDRSTVVALLIRHCPALEMPELFNDFHKVVTIKVYNSTIDNWGASAAVTNTNHPKALTLYLVRVNMTDSVLPAGLQSANFPLDLHDIELYDTNLRELPDDLDSKWNVGTTIYIENSQLTAVPPVIARLEPYWLALTGNPIDELPPEIFEVPSMVNLGVGGTNIRELPRNVTSLSPSLGSIYVTATNVSFVWSWIDPLVERSLVSGTPALIAGGSTYCADLDRIEKGETAAFRVLPSPEYSVLLTDASATNRETILRAVNCDVELETALYPIAIDDANNAIV